MNSMTHSAKQREKFRAIQETAGFGRTRAGLALGDDQLSKRFPAQGWLNRFDPFEGVATDPQSLHKYAYVHGDPVNGVDPSGQFLFLLAFALGSPAQLLWAAGAVGLTVWGAYLWDHWAYGTPPNAGELKIINAAVTRLQASSVAKPYAEKASLVVKEVIPFGGGEWGQNRPFAANEILLPDQLLDGTIGELFVASTILHETLHTTQFPFYKSLWGEQAAWQLQNDYLREHGIKGLTVTQVRDKFRGTRDYTTRPYLDDLAHKFIDYAIENPAIIPDPENR